MSFLTSLNRLSWKYITGINIGIIALAVTVASISNMNRSTEHRSQAFIEPLPSPKSVITVDETHPPRLKEPDPNWAKIGDAILIKGENLGTVPFGTLYLSSTIVPAANLVEWQPDHIVFTVPENAVSGLIKLTFTTSETKQLELITTSPLEITTTNR